MTNPSTEADPLAEDHAAPDAVERLKTAGCRTTAIARDNVWLITGGLFLLGIAIGAAAAQAATPECSVRNASQRSLRKLGKRSSQLSHDLGKRSSRLTQDFGQRSSQVSRDLAHRISSSLPSGATLSDRLANVADQFRFW